MKDKLLPREEQVKKELENLQMHEKAVIRFLEHLILEKKKFENDPDNIISLEVSLNSNNDLQNIIEQTKSLGRLPFSFDQDKYAMLTWRYAVKVDHPKIIESTKNLSRFDKLNYINSLGRGTNEIRIKHITTNEKQYLMLFANIGNFSKMDTDFHNAFDKEKYPIMCSDKQGYVYKNSEYVNLENIR